MKQILGKIFLILFLTINGFAQITASVNPPAIYKGDVVNFIISADGGDINFPQIQEIAGYPIVGTSSSQSVNIINGDMTKTISKTYSFRPDKPVTIPPLSITVDGKSYKTQELKVSVQKPNASQNGDPFVVEMKINKTEAFVGEAIDLSVSFKRKLNARVNKLQLSDPKLEDFWVKKVDKQTQSSEGDYIVETVHYQIFPQKSGEYKIPAIEAMIGVVQRNRGGGVFDDPFFSAFNQQLNWKKIYSNSLNIKVKPLPNGLELYGKYQIQAKVDKQKVHANKPVNLTINIQGEGNIDDVKKFNPTIDNTIVYADEPKITSSLVGGVYRGKFTQKIAIIADQNFTIPSMELKYFNKDTKEVKTVSTKPIDIEVIGGGKGITKPSSVEVSPSQTIQAPTTPQTIIKKEILKEDGYIKYLFLALGFILGALSVYSFNIFQNRVGQKENDIVKMIRKAKSDKVLFEILLPYAKKDKVITNVLNKLEANIYKGAKNKIDKEELMEVFE
ncbi:MAG TPA: protein BatD [Campylobacterales bacterium]|nr:protein BatD [Campylobacterales bacterium]